MHARARMRVPAARGARVVKTIRPQAEGAGKAGCPEHPQPVCIGSKHTVVTTSTPEITRLSPRMVLTVSFVLSPATNSFCHRRQRIKTCLSPVGPTHLRRLSISNGCQDHTTSPYAATSPNASIGHVPPAEVLAKPLKRRSSARRSFAHRPKPALRLPIHARRCRVHRIPPRVRDDREPPLFRVGRASL